MKSLIIASVAASLLSMPLALAEESSTPTTKPTTHVTVGTDRVFVNTGLSNRCTALGRQFDRVKSLHTNDKNIAMALATRNEGADLCASQNEMAGTKYLESALRMLGVKPE
ncbi:MAG: hypothetical protein R3D05_08205 [Dongiaceae bacterium]